MNNRNPKKHTSEKSAYISWHLKNPPDAAGYHYCHYCSKPLTNNPEMMAYGVEPMTIDHYLSRGRRPDLSYDPSNFVVVCYQCNSEKGSLSGDEYIEKKERNK